MPIRVEITGHRELIRDLNKAPGLYSQAMRNAVIRIEGEFSKIVEPIFGVAIASAGEGFPPIYGEQLMRVVSRLGPEINVLGLTVSVEFDFDRLGDYEQFSEGFHYQAMLAEGGRVELPYQGENLKNEFNERYDFWLQISDTWGGRIPGGGHLNETYAARVAYWDSIGVAPQWLLLNYGEGRYEPYVRPFPLVETINSALYTEFYRILEYEIDKVTIALNSGSSVEAPFKSRPSTRPIRGAGGRFTGSEKV